MSTPQWLTEIPAVWRATVALVAVGVATAAMMSRSVPGQVATNADRIEAVADTARGAAYGIESHISTHAAQYARIICLLTLPDTVSPLESERRCPG